MVCSFYTKMPRHRKVLLQLLRQGSMLMVLLIGWKLVASVIICFGGTCSYLRRTEVNICPMSSPSILLDTSRSHLYSVHHELNRFLISQCQKCLQDMSFITSYWRNLTTASLSSSASREGAWVYLCHRNITGMNDWKSPFDRQSFCKFHCFSISVKNKEVKAFVLSSQPFCVLIWFLCQDFHTAFFKLRNEVQKYPL